ncbi:MAG: aspartate-semialdehyde dehydrogenase [Alphaproteobacteria bacterium]|nr:aspartate-semialdehyde dehydrogenase [Alphaproteobacteria bacterium]HCQ70594.1 aspartate-semialdehyde dehydrogenase [Rhodospirillaceae bacterium]|tara:strand:- start:39330 stop:40352 length:1023 start_codon:yes stop_codon:yes gene_type:complete
MGYKVAIMGATGNVGREVLNILEERNFPVDEVIALASSRSAGSEVFLGDKAIKVQDLATFDFKGVDIVLSSPGGKISAQYAPKAAEAGAIVIDNTSHFRMDPDVPLIVPEVNPEAINDIPRGIIANPNCSTIQMVVALKPLHEAAKIKRVVVSTYQSVSGSGKAAMDELFNQTKGIYMNQSPTPEVYPKQIAFNAIPQIDVFMDDGMTKEEWKMVVETKKILDKSIKVCANCVRIPVFVGHAEMVNVELEGELSAIEAKELFRNADGVTLVDLEQEDLEFVTQAEVQGEDDVYVSRVREDISVENGLNFWCVSDNLRKGAALNTVQIAELLVKKWEEEGR